MWQDLQPVKGVKISGISYRRTVYRAKRYSVSEPLSKQYGGVVFAAIKEMREHKSGRIFERYRTFESKRSKRLCGNNRVMRNIALDFRANDVIVSHAGKKGLLNDKRTWRQAGIYNR